MAQSRPSAQTHFCPKMSLPDRLLLAQIRPRKVAHIAIRVNAFTKQNIFLITTFEALETEVYFRFVL